LITLRYINSACIITSTKDLVLLHDPWFTDGAFDGAWFTFPYIADPITFIWDCD